MFGWKTTLEKREPLGNVTATAVKSGLISGTKVATGMGWRSVEAIAEGDKVLTFDAGFQVVSKVSRHRLWSGEDTCPRQFWPLEVPAGALGNREAMQVLPAQNIMLESDTAEHLYGDPFTLMPAEAIEGLYGVARTPPEGEIEVVTLHFAADQVVFAENGALFFCPGFTDMVNAPFTEESRPFYSILSMDEARFLAVQIEVEIAAACSNSPQDTLEAAVPA